MLKLTSPAFVDGVGMLLESMAVTKMLMLRLTHAFLLACLPAALS